MLLEAIVHALFPLGRPEVKALFEHASDDPHNGFSELAHLRSRQLNEEFVFRVET